MSFPIDFPKCPNCGCKDTVSALACAAEPSIPKGTFTSLDKLVTPIQDPAKMSLPSIKAIVTHYDICANPKCGLRRCTRAEIVSIPVTMAQRPSSNMRNIRSAR